MPVPVCLRGYRGKAFGAVPMDRNAKVQILAYARAGPPYSIALKAEATGPARPLPVIADDRNSRAAATNSTTH